MTSDKDIHKMTLQELRAHVAEAHRPVADAEQATLIAERDEARAEAERLRGQRDKANSRTLRMWERAEAAEAEVRDLRAKVAGLAGALHAESYPVTCADWEVGYKDGLREASGRLAALASVGRTEPEGGRPEPSDCCGHDHKRENWPLCVCPCWRTEPEGAGGCDNTTHVCSCGWHEEHREDCNVWLNDAAPAPEAGGA